MIYTRSFLKSRINAKIQNRIGLIVDQNELVNDVARQVITDVDLRSAIRKSTITPFLFNDIYSYTAPSDLKEQAIIDLPPQVKRNGREWFLTTPEEFDRKKENLDGFVAIDDSDGIKKLLLAAKISDQSQVISELDSLTSGGGTWQGFGDGTNLSADSDNYVKGSGAVKFDINSSAGTTAGIFNSSLNSFSIADFTGGNGAVFVWVYLSNASNITNFILRIGQSASAYYSKTITSAHDSTAFVQGWNLLRFDLTSLSSTGSPTTTACSYVALYMTKDTSKVSQTDFRFDWLVSKRGAIYQSKYYSKYPWIDISGTYKENSTVDTDYIIADTTEFEIYLSCGKWLASEEIDEYSIAESHRAEYLNKISRYQKQNPSEKQIETVEYYRF